MFSCLANSGASIEASRVFGRELAENSGLDPAISRNRAMVVMWNLLKTGSYHGEVMIDRTCSRNTSRSGVGQLGGGFGNNMIFI